MDISRPLRLLPTLPMLAECLTEAGWRCEAHIRDESQSYRSIRLYHRQPQLHKDVLYLLRPEEPDFPVNDYTYLSMCDHGGTANHLICPEHTDEVILDQILELFSEFQSWETAIDLLVYQGAALQELCDLSGRLLKKPVCFHDDWFVMMAMSADVPEFMEPEYLMSSARGFIPRAILEDFQDNSDYLKLTIITMPEVWITPDGKYKSLYVNLWDGPVYIGRMLVMEMDRGFRNRDFLLAEVLAQRAVLLLRRKLPGETEIHQNMDDIVFSLLQSRQTTASDMSHLLSMLHWANADRFLCLRLRPQQGRNPVMMEHMLHSDLFRSFSGSYILLGNQEQCVVVNLTRSQYTVSQIHHLLAPLCRDYCLYAGISSPVSGIRDLCVAYYQAGAAVEQAFLIRNEKWILSFSECVLEHISRNLPAPLTPGHLVSPELAALMEHDTEKGTAYFETLREYLLQERDIPKTSEALIIHRSTLLYRLKKIQTLIHTDLENPRQRLYLMLSLWILEHKKQK